MVLRHLPSPASTSLLAILGLASFSLASLGFVPCASARDEAERALARHEADVIVTGSLPPAPGGRQMQMQPASDERLLAIIAQYRKGDTAGADRLAAEITAPEQRALLEWAAIKAGGPAIRHSRVAAFIDASPQWPGQPSLRRRAEELLLEERAKPDVIARYFAIRQPLTAAGRIALASIQIGTPQEDEAIAMLRQTWRQEPLSTGLETLVLERFGAHLTRADHRSRTERLTFRNAREAALRNARRVDADYPKLVEARLASARSSGANARQIAAVPASLRSDVSFAFVQAQSLRRQNKPLEAAAAIAHVPRDADLLGDGDEWWVERRLIARKLLDIGEATKAYEVASRHRAVTGPQIIEAEWHAGWIALQFLHDPAKSMGHFETAARVAETPISIARTAYWQGRAAQAQGRDTEAQAHFARAAAHPVAYYGQLARDRLGLGDLPLRRVWHTSVAGIPGGSGARLLYGNLETRALGTALLMDLARHLTSTPELEAVARIAHDGRDARLLLAFGKIALQRGYPLDTAAFPTHGVPVFEAVGASVERAIVHAIARQESAFDPKAISHAGARGLMQMMPATARETARRTKSAFDLNLLTADPAYCARLGAAHLGDLMGEWRGSHALVFAAYNAGSGNVRNWIAAYGDPRDPAVDPLDWIERIPFSETRNYVQRVSENLGVYRKLLNEQIAMTLPQAPASAVVSHDDLQPAAISSPMP